MRILVISTSLKPFSRSRIMARACFDRVLASNLAPSTDDTAADDTAADDTAADDTIDAEWLDLREAGDIPFCDASDCWSHPGTAHLRDAVERADGIVLATPVYNYSINSAAKNLVELTGRQWEGKVVGFINAAGGSSSYMAVMGIANSLMLDFRCLIVPRFVYATGQAFDGDRISDEDVRDRIDDLAHTMIKLTAAFVDWD